MALEAWSPGGARASLSGCTAKPSKRARGWTTLFTGANVHAADVRDAIPPRTQPAYLTDLKSYSFSMSRAPSYPVLLLGILGRGLFRDRHHDRQDTVGTGRHDRQAASGASGAIRISLAACGAKLLLHHHPAVFRYRGGQSGGASRVAVRLPTDLRRPLISSCWRLCLAMPGLRSIAPVFPSSHQARQSIDPAVWRRVLARSKAPVGEETLRSPARQGPEIMQSAAIHW